MLDIAALPIGPRVTNWAVFVTAEIVNVPLRHPIDRAKRSLKFGGYRAIRQLSVLTSNSKPAGVGTLTSRYGR